MDRNSGDILWRVEGLPCEASPALVGDVLFVATTKRKLVTVHLATRKVTVLIARLPGDARVDLGVVGRSVIVTTDAGIVLRIDATGRERWRAKLDPGIPTKPCFTEKRILFATDEGYLTAIGPSDGNKLWTAKGLGEVSMPAAVDGNRVFVVAPGAVTAVTLNRGTRIKTIQISETASCAPVGHEGKLFVGCRSGRVLVLDSQHLTPRYLLRGHGSCSSPVTFLRGGAALTCFDKKQMHVFARLP